MTIQTEVKNIISELKEKGRPERLEFMKTMVNSSMTMLGVSAEDMRFVLKRINTEIKNQSVTGILSLAKQLIETDILECQMMSYELIGKNKRVMEQMTEEDMFNLIGKMDNWGSVDSFSVLISGVLWNMGKIKDETVLNWLKSDDYWIRRIAVVSTVSLNMKSHGGKGDAKRTLMICEKVIGDKNNMIIKALSWALRALYNSGKHDDVKEFMNKYDNELAPRVKREVWTKIRTGRKN